MPRRESTERVLRALEEMKKGRVVILVDDEDRENEGDLCVAAEHATPEVINFMARHGRGLICLTLTPERVSELGLPMMVESNRASRRTAFTVSIEARRGVSTGISAKDRAHTIQTAIDPACDGSDLVSPGHVFPLRSRPGGVLQRTGHTEGSVDLARLAGCAPAAVICEIMNDDGTMARFSDLTKFASEHGLHIVTIEDLVDYRMRHERLVRRVMSAPLALGGMLLDGAPGSTSGGRRGAAWTATVFESSVDQRQMLALQLGEVSSPTLVRVHTGYVMGDVLDVTVGDRTSLRSTLRYIEAQGAGIVLYLPGRASLSEELAQATAEAPLSSPDTVREFGLGAQVLAELGVRKLRLITRKPQKMIGLEGYGLEVVDQIDQVNVGVES
jgi:3,4-dihydroxy 2-butanone 4-phosphate synthase/GTP cyclohydrolase II